jgi:nitrite reductase/ring-hydroxylating ferredoxin subunit
MHKLARLFSSSVGKVECETEKQNNLPVFTVDPKDQSKWFVYSKEGVAVSATCPHYSAPLSLAPDGCSLHCGRHDQTFDRHGHYLRGPCPCDLPTRSVDPATGELGACVPRQGAVGSTEEVVAVVGGGAAAQAAISRLRDLGFPGRVVLFTEEARRPYDRTLLTKTTSEEIPSVVDEETWQSLGVELRTQTRVTAVDIQNRCLVIGNSEKFPYSKCLLTTGAKPRSLNFATSAVKSFTVRSVEDAEKVRQYKCNNNKEQE